MQSILAVSIAGLAVIFLAMGFLTKRPGFQSVWEYFLASKSIQQNLIISLLISGSFSLNGMLYQIYLGYKVGFWALLTQGLWALSFVWFAQYAKEVTGSAGLHGFLGERFMGPTRRVAAILSVIGLSLQIGWEYGVAKSAFSAFQAPGGEGVVAYAVFTIFAVTTIYTLVGGLRSNSWSDFVQNLLKGGSFVVIATILLESLTHSAPHTDWAAAILPAPGALGAELGWWGLLANLAFSLLWQFVDLTAWQTVASAEGGDERAAKKSLYGAGLWVFIAPGILGTVIGILLHPHAGLDANSIMPVLLSAVSLQPLLTVVLVVALAATIMSFIDGMILGVGFTLIADLLFPGDVDKYKLLERPTEAQLKSLEYQRVTAKILSASRVILVAVVILSTVALSAVSDRFHLDLFNQVYLVIICQLALFGPVIVSLSRRVPINKYVGASSLILGVLAGFAAAIYGLTTHNDTSVNLAPLISLGVSLLMCVSLSRRNKITVEYA